MEFLIGIAAVLFVVVLYKLVFAGVGHNAEWDNDPDQLKLAQLLIVEAQNPYSVELVNFICQRTWSANELRNRIVHALLRARLLTTAEVYKKAKEVGHRITLESYRYE